MQLRSNRVLSEPSIDDYHDDAGTEMLEMNELADADYCSMEDSDSEVDACHVGKPTKVIKKRKRGRPSKEENRNEDVNTVVVNDIEGGPQTFEVHHDDAGSEMLELNELSDPDYCSVEDSDSEVDAQHVRKSTKVPKKMKRGRPRKENRNEDVNTVLVNTIDGGPQRFEGISGFEFVDPNELMKHKKKKKNGEMRPTLMWEIWEEEHNRWIDYYITGDFDLNQQNNETDEMHEEPSELITPLLRFQKEWLAWALKQEESVIKGGILADEMGMGKTVQAIALVLAKREFLRAINGADESFLSPGSSSQLPVVNSTLVICPASALNQWKREIERFTLKGSTKVLCYQGPNRARNSLQFSGYDFVITTYNTIEADYRKVLPPKKRCEWCGKSFYERRMAVHLKYYCGPNAIRTAKQSKQDKKGKKLHFKVFKKCAKDDISEKK